MPRAVAVAAVALVLGMVVACGGSEPESPPAAPATATAATEAPATPEATASPTEADPAAATPTQPPATAAAATSTQPPATAAAATSREPEEESEFEIVTLLPPDAIPAISNPQFITAEEADAQLRLTDLVIGVSIDGEHRAYGAAFLSGHEIVNDTLGGRAIAVTW